MYFQYWIILHHTTQKSSPVAPLIYGLFSYIWGIAPPKHYPNSYYIVVRFKPCSKIVLPLKKVAAKYGGLKCHLLLRYLYCSIHIASRHVHTGVNQPLRSSSAIVTACAVALCLILSGFNSLHLHKQKRPLKATIKQVKPKSLCSHNIQTLTYRISLRSSTPPAVTYGESSSRFASAPLASLEFGSRNSLRCSFVPHPLGVRPPPSPPKNEKSTI